MAIGAAVGGAIGAVASFAIVLNTHNFFLDVGSPVEVVLQHPLSLEQDQVADAIRDAAKNPVAEQPIAPRPQFRAATRQRSWHLLHARHSGDARYRYSRNSSHRRFARNSGNAYPWNSGDAAHGASLPVTAVDQQRGEAFS